MKNRIISLLIMVSMGIALVPAANVSSAGKPAAATSWFEFNKATGGWIVKDLSRGADSGGGAFEDYGHRVQIIPYNTEPDDMPNPNGYEVLLRLPEFKADGEKWSFQDIAKVSVRFDIDWEKWADPNDRLDFQIITHSNTDDFKQHKDGGRIDEILEEAGVIREVTPLSEYPTPIVMTATPTMYKKGPYPLAIEYWAEYFKVMVTNWTSGAGFPTSPVTATVHLLDHDNNVIRLVCPDCNKEECVGSNCGFCIHDKNPQLCTTCNPPVCVHGSNPQICTICNPLPTHPCLTCKLCTVVSGNGYSAIRGRILGNAEPQIFDALEILKNLVGMPGAIDKCGYALVASLITEKSQEKGEPTIFDALEILKHLVGMIKL